MTGGGRGVGAAIARSLAAAGAGVALVARSRDQLAAVQSEIEAAGGRGLVCTADVRDRDAVEAMATQVSEQLGPVDLLVNAAGTGEAIGPTWQVDPDAWWGDVEVALRGAFLCSRALLPGMLERGFGRIVNVTSRAGTFGVRHQTAYSASRAALFVFSEALSKEVEGRGVSVFALTPGVMRTALTEHLLDSEAGRRWLPELQAFVADGRAWVSPESVGAAVVALAKGDGDALSGRWVHAQQNLEQALAGLRDSRSADFHLLRMIE